ncbi:MAG TPA: hypothetical protein VJB87_04040 [Candidatus Nanoarchaeia archaeon]|nr:hypothetical protein [Candidatus Nanoarchaeia archaeon]
MMKTVHTMIERPMEIRRALLEAALRSTEILKAEETFHDLREQKESLKKEFRLSLARLKRTAMALQKSLPVLPRDLDMPAKPVKIVESKVKDDPKVPVTTRQRLDADLRALQERINKLKI